MTDLVDAYQRREVHLAEKILKGRSIDIVLFTYNLGCFTPPQRQPFNDHGRRLHSVLHRRTTAQFANAISHRPH